MPILPGPSNPPYDSASSVLDLARTRLNDAIRDIGGDVLKNTQPFTQVIFNGAWRRLQDILSNLGYGRSRDEAIITGLQVCGSPDPASQTVLNWGGYFDGASYFDAPALPGNLIEPVRLWERATGTNSRFMPMRLAIDGVPDFPKLARNVYWEWRNDSIVMPGSTQSMDLRIRFISYLNDFADVGETHWYELPVPIIRSQDALAYLVCSEFAKPRGDIDGSEFDALAETAARKIFNRDVAMKQRTNLRRIPRSGRVY